MSNQTAFIVREYAGSAAGKGRKPFVVGADIGGTNTNLMLAAGESPVMVASWHTPTAGYLNLVEPLSRMFQEARSRYGAVPESVAIAAAGPVMAHRRCKLTNAPLSVDADDIEKALGVQCILLNDFEAIGFSVNILSRLEPSPLVELQRAEATQAEPGAMRAALGAGTGLGKSILVNDRALGFYVPYPSEGGHTDFAAQNDQEWRMAGFARQRLQRDQVFYEDFLSGRGIAALYDFMREQGAGSASRQEIAEAADKAAAISRCSLTDDACRKAFEAFISIYARCARNLALDLLARGGLYIAGGIAAKNSSWFTDGRFAGEFERHATYSHILKRIPLNLITTYDAGMIGAVFAASRAKRLKEWWG